MLNFSNWEKKKKNYTLTKGSNGLPLFVLDNPLTQDDDDPVLLAYALVSEPKTKSIPQQVLDYITRHF